MNERRLSEPLSARSPTRTRLLGYLFGAGTLAAIVSCSTPGRLALGHYQIPYRAGTKVEITADFESHVAPKPGMYDMKAVLGPKIIAAAAPGWIRFIEDGNSGNGANKPNNYVWIEHPYPYCQDPNDPLRNDWAGKPADYEQDCIPCEEDFCNEWTVYAHMLHGSVTLFGNKEGDWIEGGASLGFEGDVGYALGGPHLHWHVAIIDPDITPDPASGWYQAYSHSREGDWPLAPELFASICFSQPLVEGSTYVAQPCECSPSPPPAIPFLH